MIEELTSEVLTNFEDITSYDIALFLRTHVDFLETDYNDIVSYYEGNSMIVPTLAFNKLKWLRSEYKKIIDIFSLNASLLLTYDYWVLLEYIEEIGTSLETASNASKWLRSVPTKNGYKQVNIVEHIAAEGASIESLERYVLGSSDPEESWVETAMDNDLREEDYTTKGGYLLKVNFKNGTAFFINSVVDNIDSAEKTYGLDVKRKIEIQDNDIVSLGYRETIIQAAEIYAGLKVGDNPAIPDDGVDPRVVVGSTIAGASYPIVFRQLASVFAKDDSFKEFQIQDVVRDKDAVIVKFQVKTRAGEVVPLISRV